MRAAEESEPDEQRDPLKSSEGEATMRAMRCRTLLAATVFVIAMASTLRAQTTGVEIELSHHTPGEQSEAERLRHVLGRFDLTPWVFTRRVLIDGQVPPHSHPVLTIGYGDHGDDNLLLSNFVHEQLHWWFGSTSAANRCRDS